MGDFIKPRKFVAIDYYTPDDFEQVTKKLPGIVDRANRKSLEVLEPTINERIAVRNAIKKFLRETGRKVYGGTAVNDLLKIKNPADAIYDDYSFRDIEFYSPTPVPDLVQLCDELYANKFKFVTGVEAQHEGTYKIHVNFELYCDITYVPTNVYNGIKTIVIDGINYADPHFLWIDHLRIYNTPLTSFGIWEKNFKRSYLLLKYYPLEHFDKPIYIDKPSDEFYNYFLKIKKEFLTADPIREFTLLGGFDAYNFYIRHAGNLTPSDAIARNSSAANFINFDFSSLESNVPYVELFSVRYNETVTALYEFVRRMVLNKDLITFGENYPLFQFTGYSVLIKYNDKPLVKIYDSGGFCVPFVKLKIGLKYVSYQYLLMTFLMHKFRAHLGKNKSEYFNYGVGVSNLIKARNIFLKNNNLLIINDTIFSEFKITCVGSTVSPMRESQLRIIDRISKGSRPKFRYVPEEFNKQSDESKKKFVPSKWYFPNISGNPIINIKNMRFTVTDSGELVVAASKETAAESSSEDEIEDEEDELETIVDETNDVVNI